MPDLEAHLRAIAERGELTYLSVVPVAGKGFDGVTFVAQLSPASRWGHFEGRDADPVKALLKAIDQMPKPMKKRTTEELIANSQPMEKEPWDV